jgi:periplasmic protein CpxP/Spy
MKKIIIGIIALGLLVAGSIFAIAQMTGQKDRGGKGFGKGRGHDMAMPLRGLDLTDEQKAKVKEIVDQSKTAVDPLKQQMRDGRAKLAELSQTGSYDQAQVESLASDQGKLTASMIVERHKTRTAIFSLLTDEQKAKAAERHNKMGDMGKHRRGHWREMNEE